MREILFRGKRKFYGNWIEGMPTYDMNYLFKSEAWNSPDNYEVIPETVGQFTGLTDKNGVKIFEGDILDRSGISSFVVWQLDSWRYNSYMVGGQGLYDSVNKHRGENFEIAEVIGNIHDNPELLK